MMSGVGNANTRRRPVNTDKRKRLAAMKILYKIMKRVLRILRIKYAQSRVIPRIRYWFERGMHTRLMVKIYGLILDLTFLWMIYYFARFIVIPSL